ncbi:ABC transporter permease [Capsulimonas corticalis]|uniref:ABC transporter permease n=1 Tax=Capsulimonas corticalis TaxID=2219043 RepID=A0A402D4B2_9BACT|nr:glycine betaine ABC transporter substrate-binding protein [Capsulimonas corticalis]BDI29178.1 ABC transporter permease [Capsulimonas corticalis]
MTRFLAALALLFTLASSAAADNSLTVGSKRFTESYVLAEIVKQVANQTGEAKAEHKQGLGNTGIVFAALKSGAIDVYPEYTGTISQELLKEKDAVDLVAMKSKLAGQGLDVDIPLGFNDTYALAMRDDQAQKLGIKSMSDLAKHPELHYGLSPEFLKRADGWPGVAKVYGVSATPQGIDHGLAYEAIAQGQIDVMDIYSTDAKIEKYHLRVLDDDQKFFPAYDAVLLYRRDLPARLPKTWAALESLKGKITAAQMVGMNADVELRGKTFAQVAQEFIAHNLRGGAPVAAGSDAPQSFWGRLFGGDFWTLTAQHLWLVFGSLLLAVLVGVPLGVWAARAPAASGPILTVVGVIQTIPSLALLIFLLTLFHAIGNPPALAALFLYSLLPIVRNTYTGLTDIAPALRESAVALGLPAGARLRLIELPLASRAILAGIKTSAVINVGTATIAALIGAGGYGERIVSGLAVNDTAVLLTGAIPAALLALLVQGAFDLLDRFITPAGLRPR